MQHQTRCCEKEEKVEDMLFASSEETRSDIGASEQREDARLDEPKPRGEVFSAGKAEQMVEGIRKRECRRQKKPQHEQVDKTRDSGCATLEGLREAQSGDGVQDEGCKKTQLLQGIVKGLQQRVELIDKRLEKGLHRETSLTRVSSQVFHPKYFL